MGVAPAENFASSKRRTAELSDRAVTNNDDVNLRFNPQSPGTFR